ARGSVLRRPHLPRARPGRPSVDLRPDGARGDAGRVGRRLRPRHHRVLIPSRAAPVRNRPLASAMIASQMSAVLKLIRTAIRETMKPSRLAIAAALLLGACGAPDNTVAQDEATLSQPTRRAPISDSEIK